MQMLPTLARGDSNKLWIVPSEIGKALEGSGRSLGSLTEAFTGSDAAPARDKGKFRAPEKVDVQAEITQQAEDDAAESERIVQAAIAEAQELERTGRPKAASLAAPSRGPRDRHGRADRPDGRRHRRTALDDQPGPEFTQPDGSQLR